MRLTYKLSVGRNTVLNKREEKLASFLREGAARIECTCLVVRPTIKRHMHKFHSYRTIGHLQWRKFWYFDKMFYSK